jgi:peptidoglycan/LPS O-acetylase OafA/YrhL
MLASPWFAVVPVIVVAANLLHDHPVAYFGAGLTLANVGIALCLDRCVTLPYGRTGRILNAAPLVFVGLISYSLYLWQQVFLNRESASIFSAFPLNLILAVSAALASYYIVERPSLRFRRWLEKRDARRPAIAVKAPAVVEA